MVNRLPNKYGRKYLHAHTMAKSSFSMVLYFCSVSFNVRDAKAIGLSEPICPCDKIAPSATFERLSLK